MFQNLVNRNSPTQPDMKQTRDKTNRKYKSLLRCARSRFRNNTAPNPMRPKKSTSLPNLLKFNYGNTKTVGYKTNLLEKLP